MKKILFFLFLALSVMSCKDEFNVSNLPDAKAKLVVYCMPSTADTTYITVSRSIPLKQYNATQKNVLIDDAAISYQLNGQTMPVTALGNGRYRVVGKQKAGDKVQLRVEAQGLEAVEASTEIPQAIGISHLATRMVRMKEDPSSSVKDFLQLQATFTDPAETHDYYAVCVRRKMLRNFHVACYKNIGGEMQVVRVYYDYDEYLETSKYQQWDSTSIEYQYDNFYVPITTASEPLLNPLSDIDDDFDFSSEFYQNFYIFDDATINGKTYTLHLNIEPFVRATNMSDKAAKELKRLYNIEEGVEVELYHITPAYYRFLQALNDVSNNSLAQAGLSNIRTTYSNVQNGMGICAGFNVQKRQ
nr:DUF4249 domain-containing protein [uncultured Prevotella sp.]